MAVITKKNLPEASPKIKLGCFCRNLISSLETTSICPLNEDQNRP
ncbi:hypothetical protein SMAC4_13031 [Sordaria macrospora]|nr:hypothetical protein SMAC4_13031 [Sordaria macrospora]